MSDRADVGWKRFLKSLPKESYLVAPLPSKSWMSSDCTPLFRIKQEPSPTSRSEVTSKIMHWSMRSPTFVPTAPVSGSIIHKGLPSAIQKGTYRTSRPSTPSTLIMQQTSYNNRSNRNPRYSSDAPPRRRPPTEPLPNVGDEVEGTVSKITTYGAFVKLDSGRSGLLHISEIADSYIKSVSEHLEVGATVKVRVVSVESSTNKISLSIRQALSSRATGYDRVVELGGDWGHPWNDDGNTTYLELSSEPIRTRPHHWESDLSIFEPFEEAGESNEVNDESQEVEIESSTATNAEEL